MLHADGRNIRGPWGWLRMLHWREANRFRAAVMLLLGVLLIVSLHKERKPNDKMIPLAAGLVPLGLIIGTAGLINPRILNPNHPRFAGEPGYAKFRRLYLITGFGSVAAGVLLAEALYDEWRLPWILAVLVNAPR